MKTTLILGMLIVSTRLLSYVAGGPYGQFTEADCPIPISEDRANSGNFSFGYITVPEFHGKQESKSIQLAVAIFKCRKDSALYDP